ncbi:PREDICTED: protein argonaute 4B-like isoform X2 [Erythranthe guttata]|uniref:protein argonaute 4B-like isoform X2 n=1 Tax=Erythranthe guttata TaxID=4155 RepID=UPI00064D8A43|nr:PREDICTED: protein argonaute 4B-like isoform X2 [Erythranthe guttata]|eukprot:XP_012837501.1 PREDICTED: protein argonaute 4B-like isoform X2 [Erythranthe guttata]
MPCLDVGKPTRPNYRPIELCLVSVQRYTKALSRNQRASLVEKLKQNPPDIIQAMKCNYVEDHILFDCGISIEKNLTQINGRILDTPKLKVGNNEDCIPKNGPWNFNNKGPWKKKCLCGLGIVTQCISPTKIDDQYLTHVLLKINSKETHQRGNKMKKIRSRIQIRRNLLFDS